MVEKTTPFRNARAEAGDSSQRIRAELDRLADEYDLKEVAGRIAEFGRQKPMTLAVTALALGFAAGLVLRRRGGSTSG